MDWRTKLGRLQIGQKDQKRIVESIAAAVNESRRKHPQFIRADPNDHNISMAESDRRINICVDFVIEARNERGWSIERICDNVSRELDAKIDSRIIVPPAGRGWIAT